MNDAEYARVRDRVLDEACVALLRASSPFSVLTMVDFEERHDYPAYGSVDPDPRAFRAACELCRRPFVVYAQERRFCSDNCRSKAKYRRLHPGCRDGRGVAA